MKKGKAASGGSVPCARRSCTGGQCRRRSQVVVSMPAGPGGAFLGGWGLLGPARGAFVVVFLVLVVVLTSAAVAIGGTFGLAAATREEENGEPAADQNDSPDTDE